MLGSGLPVSSTFAPLVPCEGSGLPVSPTYTDLPQRGSCGDNPVSEDPGPAQEDHLPKSPLPNQDRTGPNEPCPYCLLPSHLGVVNHKSTTHGFHQP